MTINLQAERLYDQIELVRGVGSRQRGQLCIMSFVALLAGDRHTDRPRTVSPFIRNFAIQLNDGAPDRMRDDLKPFAPGIIGTSDGHDFERAALLFRTVETEVLPRAMSDFLNSREYALFELSNKSPLLRVSAMWCDSRPSDCIASCFRAIRDEHERGDCLSLATRAGKLLVTLVQCAPNSAARRWYWAKALELVDRLCDIGADTRQDREKAASITKQHSALAPSATPYLSPESVARRPMQKISHMLRTALELIIA